MIENTAAENDRVTMNLYSERGQYSKTFDVSPGKLLKINVRDLQQNGVPDDKGNLLLDTSGVMSLVGSHNTGSKLSYEKIIHSTDQADYVGLPANACDFVTVIGMWLSDAALDGQTFPVMKTYYWTQSGPADTTAGGSGTSNSSLAHIGNNEAGDVIVFTPPEDGLFRSIDINPPFPQENTTFCDACSGGAVTVVGIPAVRFRAGVENIWYEDPIVINAFLNQCGYFKVPNCSRASGILFGTDSRSGLSR